MNTAVRSLNGNIKSIQNISPFGTIEAIINNRSFWFAASLIIAIFISALSVVYVQMDNRSLFSNLQSLQNTRETLHVEWGQLLLEESTWSTQLRVQQVAEQDLQMVMPKQQDIIII